MNMITEHETRLHTKWMETRDRLIELRLREVETLKSQIKGIENKLKLRNRTLQFLSEEATPEHLTIDGMEEEIATF